MATFKKTTGNKITKGDRWDVVSEPACKIGEIYWGHAVETFVFSPDTLGYLQIELLEDILEFCKNMTEKVK